MGVFSWCLSFGEAIDMAPVCSWDTKVQYGYTHDQSINKLLCNYQCLVVGTSQARQETIDNCGICLLRYWVTGANTGVM